MPVGELKQQRGFTLIELLITLMIASIIAIIAVPAFSGFLARQQLASDVNEVISVLSFARSEAIKQRSDMDVVFSPPGNASSVQRPASCRSDESVSVENGETLYAYSGWCYWVERDDADEILRIGEAANITSPSSEFTLIFQSLGNAKVDDCASPCEITISSQRDDAVLEPVTLVIRTTGSIRPEESES